MSKLSSKNSFSEIICCCYIQQNQNKPIQVNSRAYLIMSRPITFVTGNAKKLEELRAILGKGFPREIRSEKIDLPGL